MSAAAQVDYEGLARQAGAISSQPAASGAGAIDYASMAKQAGATNYQPPAGGSGSSTDTGIWAGIRRNTVGMISGLYHAFSDPITDQEKAELQQKVDDANTSGIRVSPDLATNPTTVQLAYHRLVDAPATALDKKGQSEQSAAKDLLSQGQNWKGANLYTSGLVDRGLAVVPMVGPWLNSVAQRYENGDASGAATDVASAVGLMHVAPLAQEAVGKVLGRAQAPLGSTTGTPRGTIPANDYSPADLKAYADANGIPLTAAQATENVGLRAVQSSGERALVGGTAVKQGIQATQAAIADHAEGLVDNFSPGTPDLASQGAAIQGNVQAALDREMETSRLNYADVDDMADGTKVDLRPVKKTAGQVLSDSNFVRQAGLDPKRATSILQGITDVPNSATFSEAQQLRSALLDASRSPELAISNQAQGWLKQVIGGTDSVMMDAAETKPGLEDSFRTANDHWTQLQEDFNSPRSVLNQILSEPDPNRVPQKLTQRGQIAGSPYNAQLLDKYGIDKGPVKAAIVQDLLNRNFGLYGKNLGGYSDNFLRSLFTPDELDEVYKTGALARSAGLNTNPSGTAAVNAAIEQTMNPIRLAGQSAAAKLTNSSAFNDWMMRNRPQTGPGSAVPVSVLVNSAGKSDDQSGDSK